MPIHKGQVPQRALTLARIPSRATASSCLSSACGASSLSLLCCAFTTTRQLSKRTHHVPLGPPAPEFDPGERATWTEIMTRRRFIGRLVAGTAAGMPSSVFKRPSTEVDGKKNAMSWDGHLSLESRSRHPCTLKAAAKRYLHQKDLISLGGGLPSPDFFPIEQLNFFAHLEPFFGHLAGSPFTRTDPKTLGIPGGTYKKGKYRYKPGQLEQGTRGIREVSVKPPVRKFFAEKDQLKDGREYDLTVAQNYAQASGAPQMLRFVTEHTEVVHDPAYKDWGCAMTPGSTAALEQSLRLLCDRGSSLVTDEFAFSTALETARPMGIKVFGIPIDTEGMVAEKLDERLSDWNEAEGEKPKVLYTVPSGHNPTGTTMSKSRRHAIYKVAKKHNLVIIEDDPYHFLQFQGEDLIPAQQDEEAEGEYVDMLHAAKAGREAPEPIPEPELEENEFGHPGFEPFEEFEPESTTGKGYKFRPKIGDPDWDYFQGKKQKGRISITEAVLYAGRQATAAQKKSIVCPAAPEDYWVRSLIPSFLNLDTDGRVIRLDSFSKTLIPGLRLGWITAPEKVVQKFIQHSEVCSQGPAGMSQLVAWKLLDSAGEGWGHDGFIHWVQGLANQYQSRRNILLEACNRHLNFDHKGAELEGAMGRAGTNGLVTWTIPKAGMFLWFTIDHTKHPDYPNKSILEIEDEIFERCISSHVLLGRGSWFIAEEGKEPSRLCFRATYAAASKDQMREAIERFGKAVKKAFNIKSIQEFEAEMGLLSKMEREAKEKEKAMKYQEFV